MKPVDYATSGMTWHRVYQAMVSVPEEVRESGIRMATYRACWEATERTMERTDDR